MEHTNVLHEISSFNPFVALGALIFAVVLASILTSPRLQRPTDPKMGQKLLDLIGMKPKED